MPVGFPPSGSGSGLQNVFNFNPAVNLTKWRKALANVKSGGANARLLLVGDSTTFGNGSNGTVLTGNLIPLAPSTQLATLFNNAGINATSDSWFGNGQVSSGSTRYLNDGRLTGLSGWLTDTSLNSVGGQFVNSPENTNPLIFTPSLNTDTCNLWYSSGPLTLTFNFSANGTSPALINANAGSLNVGSHTITTTLGSNNYQVAWASGSNHVYVYGMECYNSAKKWLSICNGGWPSATAAMYAANTASVWDPISVIPSVYQPSLTLINLGVNDADGAVTVASYIASMQALITACLTTGDVVLCTFDPINPSGNASVATQNAYNAAAYQLASTNNLCLIDTYARWQSYAVSQPLGYYADTFVHPNGLGYQDIWSHIFNTLVSV